MESCWLELPVSVVPLVESLDEESLPVCAELSIVWPCELSAELSDAPLAVELELLEMSVVVPVAVEELASESFCVLASVEVVLCVKIGVGAGAQALARRGEHDGTARHGKA